MGRSGGLNCVLNLSPSMSFTYKHTHRQNIHLYIFLQLSIYILMHLPIDTLLGGGKRGFHTNKIIVQLTYVS